MSTTTLEVVPLELTAPTSPSRAALCAFADRVRRAVRARRPLVVDESACSGWMPGQLLVLERLRLQAERCGCSWTTAGRG